MEVGARHGEKHLRKLWEKASLLGRDLARQIVIERSPWRVTQFDSMEKKFGRETHNWWSRIGDYVG